MSCSATPTASPSPTAGCSPSTMPASPSATKTTGVTAANDSASLRWPPTSSSAASCVTCCRAAFTASVITVCLPHPPARSASRAPAIFWQSRRHPRMTRRRSRTMCGRPVPVAVGGWLSSKPSPAGASLGHRRARHAQPRRSLRDPARTGLHPRHSGHAAATSQCRGHGRQPCSNAHRRPSLQPAEPANRAPIPEQSRLPEMSRPPPGRFLHQPKSPIPIDRGLPTAVSFLQDFRTPSAPETLKGWRQSGFGRL